MLQTSPLTSAQCIVNGVGPAPCHIMVKREDNYVGYGFAVEGASPLVFGGLRVNDTQSSVALVTAGDTTVNADGACMTKPADSMLGCTAVVNGQRVTVIAKVN